MLFSLTLCSLSLIFPAGNADVGGFYASPIVYGVTRSLFHLVHHGEFVNAPSGLPYTIRHVVAHFYDKSPGNCAKSPIGAHLRRLFHAALGQSPQHYLTRLRLHMAATLLQHTRLPIVTIAADVGYPSISSFNRHFLAAMGAPPRAWRRGEKRGL